MSLSESLQQDARATYRAAEGLFRRVEDLSWKPATGRNWMSTGQLLKHCAESCGANLRGFLTGDWGEYGDALEEAGGEMEMPTAEMLPSVASVDEALRLLAADRALTLELLAGVDDDRLLNERSVAPWGGEERALVQHCCECIWHLGQHKGQLFYYLKLQGQDVDTMDLWMGGE